MNKLLIFGCIITCLLVACDVDSLMEEVELDFTDTEKVYSDVNLTRRVVYDLYGRMRMGRHRSRTYGILGGFGDISCAMLDNATDDGAGNTTRAGGAIEPGIEMYIKGAVTASANPIPNYNIWNFYYKAIRSANSFLDNVDQSPLDAAEKKSLKNEVRFLRAYFHHELFRWHGALVIGDKVLDPFAFEEMKRETLANTVDWMVSEFNALSQPNVLPDKYEAADFGKPTRGAAMAYKARTLLYAASPLHEQSGKTWQEAAKAAHDMISYCDDGGHYALYFDANEPDKSYTRLFNERANCEIIMSFLNSSNKDLYSLLPTHNPWNKGDIELLTAPTQSLVDAYDMIDGAIPITGYHSLTEPIINPVSGYDEQNPYKDRDPRLKQSILYNGATWPQVNGSPETIDISTPNSWGSGYFLVKFLDDRVDHRRGGKTSTNFPMMRYAEVLLMYAEAINEAENTATAREKAVEQLNRIRSRAGISNDLVASEYNQNSLRERIRKERRVELSFEEHRFFDIRRWLIAKDVMNKSAVGIKIIEGEYTRTILDSRSYNERMNLTPIPLDEVNLCPHVYQNPGY